MRIGGRIGRVLVGLCLAVGVMASSPGGARAAPDAAARLLTWEELMPPGEVDRLAAMYDAYLASLGPSAYIAEGSAADTMEQIGTYNTVAELDGKRVRLPGFPVPFDFNANAAVKEFLLVPYFGACIHTPPPPPNQVVFVTGSQAVKLPGGIYDPVWVEGTLKTVTKESDIGDAAYTLVVDSVTPYTEE